MVTFTVISEYSGGPDPGDRVKIDGGPLYPLARVQALAALPNGVKLLTTKCRHDVQNLGFDEDEVTKLLQSLIAEDYKDSEWCDNGRGFWVACDSYTIRRKEWVETAHKELTMNYFLKFAIGKAGTLVLMLSCHL
jgi:Motility quorum-sensing regulator, toxin of MqsA